MTLANHAQGESGLVLALISIAGLAALCFLAWLASR